MSNKLIGLRVGHEGFSPSSRFFVFCPLFEKSCVASSIFKTHLITVTKFKSHIQLIMTG